MESCETIELEHVHQVYDAIARHFSATRHTLSHSAITSVYNSLYCEKVTLLKRLLMTHALCILHCFLTFDSN